MHSPLVDLVADRGVAADAAAALAAVFDKLTEQAKRAKARRREAPQAQAPRRGTASPRPAASAARRRAPADGRPRIIRSRRFVAKPMTARGGGAPGGGNGDGVLVFRDAATRRINVLFRRRDGNLGSSSRGLKRARVKPPAACGEAAQPARRSPATGPPSPCARCWSAGRGAAAEAGRRPRRARPRITLARVQRPGPRPERLHRLHPLRPRADHGRQRAELPADAAARAPRRRHRRAWSRCRISCFVVTKGQQPPRSCWRQAERARDPRPRHARGLHALHQGAVRVPRGAPGPAHPPALRAPRRLRPRAC